MTVINRYCSVPANIRASPGTRSHGGRAHMGTRSQGDGFTRGRAHRGTGSPMFTALALLYSRRSSHKQKHITWCIHGVYMVYTWCIQHVYTVYTWCIHGVYIVYTSRIHRVYIVYTLETTETTEALQENLLQCSS